MEFPDSAKLRDRLIACEDIQALYEIRETDGKVSILMREPVFRQSGPTDEITFSLRITVAGRELFHRVLLTRFAALGDLMPLCVRASVAWR